MVDELKSYKQGYSHACNIPEEIHIPTNELSATFFGLKCEPLELFYQDNLSSCLLEVQVELEEDHSRCYTTTSNFACCLCADRLSDQQQYYEHVKNIHNLDILLREKHGLRCSLCNEEFSSSDELDLHQNRINKTYYQCIRCYILYESVEEAVIHFQQTHTIKFEKGEDDSRILDPSILGQINEEQQMGSIPRNHRCCVNDCFEDFLTQEQLFNHIQNIHKILPNKINRLDKHSGKVVECNACLKQFATFNSFKHHQLSPLTCGHCSFQTLYYAALANHKQLHAELPYQCDHCGKRLPSKKLLKRHMKIHLSKPRFTCEFCARNLTTLFALNRHIERCHVAERKKPLKQWSCNVCQASISPRNYTRHLLIHLDEKPYKCAYCSKLFGDASNLKRHERCHTGEKPYRCDICGNTFREKPKLRIHLRIHSGERPYSCNACGRAYRYKLNYTTHAKVCGKSQRRRKVERQ